MSADVDQCDVFLAAGWRWCILVGIFSEHCLYCSFYKFIPFVASRPLHFLLDEGQQAQLVLWMPAHTCKASVGGMRCSDGTPLTHTMRCANDIADVLAKEAASSIAMSPGMRAQLKERLLHACDLARFVGRVTFAAGHCKQDGFICRDSVGLDVASARRRRTPRQKRVGKVTKAVGEMTPSALEARSGVIAGALQRIRGKMRGRTAVCEAG